MSTQWRNELTEEIAAILRAMPGLAPDAWLYLGSYPGNDPDKDWYDSDQPLLGLPVYHCPAHIVHVGHCGINQKILPLWHGDVSWKSGIIREFESRLAKSGDTVHALQSAAF